MNPLMNMMGGSSMGGADMTQIMNIMKMLKSGNPEQIGKNLMQKNPQFRAFMEQNHGKTPEQAAKELGIDFGQISSLMK